MGAVVRTSPESHPLTRCCSLVCSETNKEMAFWLSRGPESPPQPPSSTGNVQMSLCLLSPWLIHDVCSQPQCAALLRHATQGGHCVLFIFAECCFCEQAQCLLPKNRSEANTRISTDCSVQLLLIFATHSISEKKVPSPSLNTDGKGEENPSCHSTFPFLFLV